MNREKHCYDGGKGEELHKKKRMSSILVIAMCLSMPSAAFAAEGPNRMQETAGKAATI